MMERGTKIMQVKFESSDDNKAVSLDQIIDLFMSNVESDPKSERFAFIKIHDQNIMSEIKNYSRHIRKPEFDDISEQNLECVVEKQSSKLLDSIYCANIDYLKSGMKLGARLILDLLV